MRDPGITYCWVLKKLYTRIWSFDTRSQQSSLCQSKGYDISSFRHSTNQASSLSPPAKLGKTPIFFPALYLASALIIASHTTNIYHLPTGCTLFLLWNIEDYRKICRDILFGIPKTCPQCTLYPLPHFVAVATLLCEVAQIPGLVVLQFFSHVIFPSKLVR
jgi:hypothetical protein